MFLEIFSLKYLVFEEQELYSEQNLKEIPEVIAIAEQHHEKYRISPLTTVFATNQWTSNMETMFTDIRFGKKRNIVAFFYQMSELVKFANVNWNLTLATGEEDDDARFRLLNGKIFSKHVKWNIRKIFESNSR